MAKPTPPKLPHPSAAPIQTASGRQSRDRPIFAESGGEGRLAWEVEVTPLTDTTSSGRPLDPGPLHGAVDLAARIKPRAIFEVRAHFRGPGGSAFGRRPNVIRSPQIWVEEQELAMAMARAFAEQLRAGKREFGDDPMGEMEALVKARR